VLLYAYCCGRGYDAYLTDYISVVEGCQCGSLLVSIPVEFAAILTLQRHVARTLFGAADVTRGGVRRIDHVVLHGHGGLVNHRHDSDTQGHTQSERAEQAEESHRVEHQTAERNKAPGSIGRAVPRLCHFERAALSIYHSFCWVFILYGLAIGEFVFWLVVHYFIASDQKNRTKQINGYSGPALPY